MLKISGVIAVLLAALLVYAATLPDTFRVQRATTIEAPPERIFPLVNDFHAWDAWSPYLQKDPAMKKTFSGAAAGAGAIFEWDGNRDVGKGRVEITEASPSSKVAMRLHMAEPFNVENAVELILTPNGETTEVAWAMQGPLPYLSRILSVFIDMEDMVGRDFETGLANLKRLAER